MTYKKTHTDHGDSSYIFQGIDSWNGKQITGYILYRPWNGTSRRWSVVFHPGQRDSDCAFEAKTLKECKQWLEA